PPPTPGRPPLTQIRRPERSSRHSTAPAATPSSTGSPTRSVRRRGRNASRSSSRCWLAARPRTCPVAPRRLLQPERFREGGVALGGGQHVRRHQAVDDVALALLGQI